MRFWPLNYIFTFVFCSVSLYAQANLSFTNISDSLGNTGMGPHSTLFCDVNKDGRPDIYITMYFQVDSTIADLLYMNVSGLRFHEEGEVRGVDDLDGGSHGAVFADLDNDGDYDLINGSTVKRPEKIGINNNVYQNDGDGYFADVTNLSPDMVSSENTTRAVLAVDINCDGYLDIFSVTGSLGTDDPTDEFNEVYLNNHAMHFEGVGAGDLLSAPACQGATDTDFDGDGDVDIIAANRTGELNILRNDGNGNFTLVTPVSSIGINHGAGDGITMGDVDNDGDLDMLLVSGGSVREAYLYKSNGDGTFKYHCQWKGVKGYMGGFGDLDNDGDLDLVFASDTSCYINDGSGNFTRGPFKHISPKGDFRSVAFSDIDDDGDLDFAIADKQLKSRLIRNDLTGGGHWLKVELISPQGQAGAFGAKVWVYSADEDSVLLGFRESRSSNGYLAQNDPVLHFGLGINDTVNIVVRFLDGTKVERSRVACDQTIQVNGQETKVSDQFYRDKNFSLSQNFPNPFNSATSIYYTIPEDCHVSISIYNTMGRKIKTLVDRFMISGSYHVKWNGDDDKGRGVSSGIYIVNMDTGSFRLSRKITIIK